MKLKNLKLISYGKFKDTSIDLKEGLNVIFGENEAGKSTVMSFIRAMLYGFGEKKADPGKSERTRFSPWSGEKMAGEMTITHEGRSYRITRSSGKTKAGDKITITDMETGLLVEDDVGEWLGIGEAGYTETAFIRQMGSRFSGSDEVTAHLLNLSESGNEDTSITQSTVHLKNMYRKLKHEKGDGGAIGEMREKVRHLQQILLIRKEEHAQEIENAQEKKECEAKLEELKPRILELSKALSDREKNLLYKEYYALQKEADKKKERYSTAQREEKKEAELFGEYTVFEGSSSCPYASAESTEQMEWELEKIETKKKNLPLFYIGGGVLTAIFLVAGLFMPYLFIGMVLGLFLLGIGIYQGRETAEKGRMIKERLSAIENKNRERLEFLHAFSCETPEEYNEKRSAYMTAKAKVGILEKQTDDAKGEWEEAKSILTQKEEEIKERFGSLEEYRPTMITSDVLSEKEKLEKEQLFLTERLATLSITEDEGETPAEISERIEEANKKLNDYQKKEAALSLAMKALKEAHEELSRDFAPKVNRRASKILEALTGGKHNELFMTKDYKVELRESEMHKVDYFSNGTADQVYLALRLAISELIFEGKDVPIILDDPFTQYDKKREAKAMEFLKEYAKEKQVILFTARPSEEPTFTL